MDFTCSGQSIIKIWADKTDKEKPFTSEWFYINMIGDQHITVKLSFGGNLDNRSISRLISNEVKEKIINKKGMKTIGQIEKLAKSQYDD